MLPKCFDAVISSCGCRLRRCASSIKSTSSVSRPATTCPAHAHAPPRRLRAPLTSARRDRRVITTTTATRWRSFAATSAATCAATVTASCISVARCARTQDRCVQIVQWCFTHGNVTVGVCLVFTILHHTLWFCVHVMTTVLRDLFYGRSAKQVCETVWQV